MSAEQTGRPTEGEWAEALIEARQHDQLNHPDATTCTEALIEGRIAREREAAKAEGMAAVAGPLLAEADAFDSRLGHVANGFNPYRNLVPTDATEALARLKAQWKAEAWDEGFTRGFYDVLAGGDRDASESPAVNPYRTPEDAS